MPGFVALAGITVATSCSVPPVWSETFFGFIDIPVTGIAILIGSSIGGASLIFVTLTIPAPKYSAGPTLSALAESMAIILSWDNELSSDLSNAALAATKGAASEVPLLSPKPPPGMELFIETPGAAISIAFPKLEKEALLSFVSVAATVITLE